MELKKTASNGYAFTPFLGDWHGEEMKRWAGTIYILLYFVLFWPCHTACGTLVSWPGIEPTPPALKVRSLNHLDCQEVPQPFFLVLFLSSYSSHAPFLVLFQSLHIMVSFSVFVNVIILISGVSKSWTRQVRSLPCGRAYIYPGGQAGEADGPITTGGLSEHSTWLTQQQEARDPFSAGEHPGNLLIGPERITCGSKKQCPKSSNRTWT